MALERWPTPYGPPALHALRVAIDQLQAGDPLAPVTVLVHSNAVGVAARRWLAAHGGVAAAQFLTSFRFAELLGGPLLAQQGRRPVSVPVVDVAVRDALGRSAGVFRPIAAHQATVTAVRDAHRDLRHVPPAAVTALATRGSARAREVARLHREVQRTLQGEWYDEADLLAAAAQQAATAPPRTVVFLPQRLRSTEHGLLQALARHGTVLVVDGVHEVPAPSTLQVVDASDADEEVRDAVRVVAAAVHDGTPLHRIALVWPRTQPYARLVSEQLLDAGIAWNGRPGIELHERLAARLVLDLFRLDRRGIRRADLFALLAHVPARTAEGASIPRQRWERLARDAGLAGDADWATRLPAFAAARRAAAGRAGDDAGRHLAEAEAAEQLAEFVAELRTQLGPPGVAQRWQHWAEVAQRLLLRWLGRQPGIARLPADEVDAYHRVQAALDRLARLDPLTGPTTRAAFADTLQAELDGAPGRAGHLGVGVHIGPLSFAVGQLFDLMVVVGACEGLLPAPPPPEALLADPDRQLTDGALALDADLVADQQRQLWAALAGARRAVVLTPRGDLRATAERRPSRWLPELSERTAHTERTVPSFAASVADTAFPATLAQHRIRALVHATRSGLPVHDHPLVVAVEPLRLGVAMLRARALPVFTEYDGNLSGLPVEPFGRHPVSPTRLEAWVACPHAWFLRYVLGILPVEQPDEQLQITPRDRGTLVHAALDRFHRQVVDGRLPQPDGSGWAAVHRQALLDAFQAEGTALAAQGATGRVAFWISEQARQRHELVEWLRRDGELAVARGATVLRSEHAFGMGDDPPAAIRLADGSEVLLRGSVDRIDRCADGSLVVTDHKTGSRTSYADISRDDPTAGGTRFQLPGYAAAAQLLVGAPPDTPVHAEYSFFAKGDFRRIGSTVGPATWPTVAQALQRVVDGIRSGMFIALPEKSQFRRPSFVACEYCDPDHLGTAEKWAEFERKRHDPAATVVLGTVEAAGAGGGDDRGDAAGEGVGG